MELDERSNASYNLDDFSFFLNVLEIQNRHFVLNPRQIHFQIHHSLYTVYIWGLFDNELGLVYNGPGRSGFVDKRNWGIIGCMGTKIM